MDNLEQFNEAKDDEDVVKDLFRSIDKDASGSISRNEMHDYLERIRTVSNAQLIQALEVITSDLDLKDTEAQDKSSTIENSEISFDRFLKAVNQLPRVRGQRVQWANTLGLGAELARFLKKGDIFDGLKGLRSMSEDEVVMHVNDVCKSFSEMLPKLIFSGLKKLRENVWSAAEDFKNSKFCMDGAYEGSFATLADFQEGPEKLIGSPNPNVEKGIAREHCERRNAKQPFTSSNYGITTCPAWEWEFVVCPRPAFAYPHTPADRREWRVPAGQSWRGEHGRDPTPLDAFLSHAMAHAAALHRSEVTALRLYTGPMFNLYNAALRKHPPALHAALHGNAYETTLFCIISAVLKLSKHTAVPPDRRLFRGLGGMILPDQFWRAGAAAGGLRGAVEWGLMSTTTQREVAVQYSGVDRARGTVLEIAAGRVDIGATLGWLSQYPREEEVPFPRPPVAAYPPPRSGTSERIAKGRAWIAQWYY
jgi:hypothetical protein